MIDNRCEVCRFFSTDATDWPSYDAKASCEAQGYLGQLHKDVADAVQIIEKFVQDLSWYLRTDDWSWGFDLSHYVANLLMARSSLILFFIDSLSSYNANAHRGNKNHSRDTLNADWSLNDCRAQLLLQSMSIRYKTSAPQQPLDGHSLVFRICSIVQSTAKALTPHRMDAVKQIVTQSARYKNLLSAMNIKQFLEPAEQLMASHSKSSAFLAKHASCFSNTFAFETAFILISSGFFVIETSSDHKFKLQVPRSCPLHEAVVALKSCGTGIAPLHILTLLVHSLQPHAALALTSRPKQDADVDLDAMARRLVQQYCHSGAGGPSQLMGGRKLMECMAAASQMVAPPATGSETAASEDAAVAAAMDEDDAVESDADGASDGDDQDEDEDGEYEVGEDEDGEDEDGEDEDGEDGEDEDE